MTEPFQLGSISTGTLRTDDLLKTFATALDKLDSKKDPLLVATAWDLTRRNHAGQQECEDRLADLEMALQELCPPFVYFGAHPACGSNFGFFIDWDALEAAGALPCNEHEECDEPLPDQGVIIRTMPKQNITCLDMDHNVLWSTI